MPMSQKGLAKLTEELGELLQEVGKAQAMNLDIDTPHWDGKGPLRARLIDEMADVEAAIAFVRDKFGIDPFATYERRHAKLMLFLQWDKDPNS